MFHSYIAHMDRFLFFLMPVSMKSGSNPFSSVGRPTLMHQREKKLAGSPIEISIMSHNVSSTSSVVPNKIRIRWTQDLHERFVQCVNQLGGADSNFFFLYFSCSIVKLCTCIITNRDKKGFLTSCSHSCWVLHVL